MSYEWDPAKARGNRQKPGIDFRDAIAALDDPRRLEEIDDRLAYGEERTIVIGMAAARVLFVVVTNRGEDTCRLISARKATRHEEDRYYASDSDAW